MADKKSARARAKEAIEEREAAMEDAAMELAVEQEEFEEAQQQRRYEFERAHQELVERFEAGTQTAEDEQTREGFEAVTGTDPVGQSSTDAFETLERAELEGTGMDAVLGSDYLDADAGQRFDILQGAEDQALGAADLYEALTGKPYATSTFEERYTAAADEAVLQETHGSREAFQEATGRDWDASSSEDRLTAAFEYADQLGVGGSGDTGDGGTGAGTGAFGVGGGTGVGAGAFGGAGSSAPAGGSTGGGESGSGASGGDQGDQGDGDGVGGVGTGTTGGGSAATPTGGSSPDSDIDESSYDADGNPVFHSYTRTEGGWVDENGEPVAGEKAAELEADYQLAADVSEDPPFPMVDDGSDGSESDDTDDGSDAESADTGSETEDGADEHEPPDGGDTELSPTGDEANLGPIGEAFAQRMQQDSMQQAVESSVARLGHNRTPAPDDVATDGSGGGAIYGVDDRSGDEAGGSPAGLSGEDVRPDGGATDPTDDAAGPGEMGHTEDPGDWSFGAGTVDTSGLFDEPASDLVDPLASMEPNQAQQAADDLADARTDTFIAETAGSSGADIGRLVSASDLTPVTSPADAGTLEEDPVESEPDVVPTAEVAVVDALADAADQISGHQDAITAAAYLEVPVTDSVDEMDPAWDLETVLDGPADLIAFEPDDLEPLSLADGADGGDLLRLDGLPDLGPQLGDDDLPELPGF